MHYPGHKRDQFVNWIDAGCQPFATVEVNYVEQEIPADAMLRQMLRCTDFLPGSTFDDVSGLLGIERHDWHGTYGDAARRLLEERTAETVEDRQWIPVIRTSG